MAPPDGSARTGVCGGIHAVGLARHTSADACGRVMLFGWSVGWRRQAEMPLLALWACVEKAAHERRSRLVWGDGPAMSTK